MLIDLFQRLIYKREDYKRLWEEQNKLLDNEKLKSHRKDKQNKKLELKVEKLEKEIINLKAHRASKKAK